MKMNIKVFESYIRLSLRHSRSVCACFIIKTSMNANCVICADLFDEKTEIVAAPCGHVYHAKCLTTWIHRSKSCPQCRSHTLISGILKLYFNFLSQSETNSSDLENEIVSLTSRLNAKESELRTCKQERDNHIAYACDAEENASDLMEAISTLQYEVSQLRAKAQSLSTLHAKNFELEQINTALSNDLEHFRGIQAIVSGTQKDVDDILREHSNHSNSAEQLATYCACLKRQLLEAVHHQNNLMLLNSKMEYENSVYAAKLKFYEDAMGVPKSEFQTRKMAPLAKPVSSTLVSSDNLSASSHNSRNYVEEICLSPLSVAFNRNRLNLRIEASNGVSMSSSNSQTDLQYVNKVSETMRKKEEDSSVIKIHYNGLDSRGKMTTSSSGFKKIKIMKLT